MDAQVQQQKMREKVEDHHHHQQQQQQQRGGKEEGHRQQQEAVMLSSSSPPSASSSPTHEFSFTISLHQPSTTLAKPPPPSIAVDLSPADDIFFHGHLLPLHLLSHLPVSPRSSTNSLDSFTLPIKELLEHHHHPPTTAGAAASASETKERPPKSKSFSLFGLSRWKSKGFEDREKGEIIKEKHNKRKARFDLSHVLKRYVRMVRPLLSSLRARRRENNLQLRRRQQPYSFSGNLTPRGRQELRGRRGDQLFSAPASMRTSPTNSGLLVATSGAVPTSTSDSTMEELQAAIQAAIAHCKNSIAMEDKVKC